MSCSRVGTVLALILCGCARLDTEGAADAGADGVPAVTSVEPDPGPISPTASFVVHFSEPMDEGLLLAKSGRSETVALAAAADVERAAAALEHGSLSSHERTLFVSAAASVASNRRSVTLAPDLPLPTGGYFLLVSPRLKDVAGRKIAGSTPRYEFDVRGASRPKLVAPPAGADAPTNLSVVRVAGSSGPIALVGPDGAVISAVDGRGDAVLPLSAPLIAGARYTLSADGLEQRDQFFTAAACARTAPPAVQDGSFRIAARDTSVQLRFKLDWPAEVEARVGRAAHAGPCEGDCIVSTQRVVCAPPSCGPQVFACDGELRVGSLIPATEYSLRIVLRDDEGHAANAIDQQFTTVAGVPRLVISELKASPAAGEYVELLNLGPGAADVSNLALIGPDGTLRPLLGETPPLPVLLEPRARALAVGSSFDSSLYPSIPTGTAILRASTRRLLGHGLRHRSPPAFRLVMGRDVVVELSRFPGGMPSCPPDASFQRDEAAPPDADAAWTCGKKGGTPGAPP